MSLYSRNRVVKKHIAFEKRIFRKQVAAASKVEPSVINLVHQTFKCVRCVLFRSEHDVYLVMLWLRVGCDVFVTYALFRLLFVISFSLKLFDL